jgi:hypothetical protein
MRRGLIFLGVVLAATVVGVPAAMAQSFSSATAAFNGDRLIVSFTETGLAADQPIDYAAHTNVTATLVCVNRGGVAAGGKNGTGDQVGDETSLDTFTSSANGEVTGQLTLSPPPPFPPLTCPSNQSPMEARVVYTNVSITDKTNGNTEPIPGPFDTGCLLPDVRGACG